MRQCEELWREGEKAIQANARLKDVSFKLDGPWKFFLMKSREFNVYIVDEQWVRRNLCWYFGHGGHGYVHEFIPLDELWISKYHRDCECVNVISGQPVSDAFVDSTILHETIEMYLMARGYPYHKAHEVALEAERKAGYLKDPYGESNV